MALPAAAQASYDLSIGEVPSAKVVDKGQAVTFAVTVANPGTEAAENVFVNLSSLRGHGQGAGKSVQVGLDLAGVAKTNRVRLTGTTTTTSPANSGCSRPGPLHTRRQWSP